MFIKCSFVEQMKSFHENGRRVVKKIYTQNSKKEKWVS